MTPIPMTTSDRPWETLRPGDLWRGFFQIDDGHSKLPVLAAQGVRPGPMLLAVAGVHGDEHEGTAAIHALFEDMDTSELNGTIVGLPVANVAATAAHSRTSPSDGGDLNRFFPGDDKSLTGRLARTIFDHFVQSCDVLIDMHSGGSRLMHLPLVGWYAGSEDAERLARRFGESFHPWLIPDVPGVLSYEAYRLGKIALGLEWGGGGALDPLGVTAYKTGLLGVMSSLAMLPSRAEPMFDPRPPIAGDYLTVETDGFFRAEAALGDHVTVGTCIGVMTGTLGELVASVHTTREGTLAALPHIPRLEAGDRVAYIG